MDDFVWMFVDLVWIFADLGGFFMILIELACIQGGLLVILIVFLLVSVWIFADSILSSLDLE